MSKSERVTSSVLSVIDEVNTTLPEDKQIPKSLDVPLFGAKGVLDSLGLVTFIVAVEQRLEQDFGMTVTIADEKAMSQKNSPFRNIGTLCEYVTQLLDDSQ